MAIWDKDYKAAAETMANTFAGEDAPLLVQYQAVLAARVAETAATASRAQVDVARWTKRLASVTLGLAMVTLLLAVGATVFAARSFDAQRDAARSAERMACLADLDLSVAIVEYGSPEAGSDSSEWKEYRRTLIAEVTDGQRDCEG